MQLIRVFKVFKAIPGWNWNEKFDLSQWPRRSNEQHRNNVKRILRCKTKAEQASLESSLGCHYSVLLELPFFDPIRMAIIDPMHNLYLGTETRL